MSAEVLIERGGKPRPEIWSSLAMPASELINDRVILDQSLRFASSVLLERVVEIEDAQPIGSLMDAVSLASKGDLKASAMVSSNVATDLMERTIKAGFVSQSRMDITESGQLMQHGQSYQSVQANSLRYVNHPVMRDRVWAETKNCFRLEQLIEQGTLNEYSFVVFSLAEKDMPEHFFSDTKTLTIQVSRQEEDELITDIAFIAGKTENAQEHDKATVSKIINSFSELTNDNQDQLTNFEEIAALSNAELLDRPWLIHNSLLPNGVLDLVKLYDDLVGGTFYGQNQPRQDYKEHRVSCSLRSQNYAQAVKDITNQLIAEADQFDSPLMASKRLDQLSRSYSMRLAVLNDWIDPQVFGSVSAEHIARARMASAIGDINQFSEELSKAVRHDTSTSCPGAISSIFGGLGSDSLSESLPKNGQEDKYGSLSFYCQKGHLNTRPKNHLIDRCKVCKISVKCS